MDASKPDAAEIAERLRAIGVSESYASLIANGHRAPSQAYAIDIYRMTSLKLGPIASATDDDIDALERLVGAGKLRRAA